MYLLPKEMDEAFCGETEINSIIRISDGALIPKNNSNKDYQEYLEWVAEGNTAELADE
jgi:hypothetical protein